MNKYIKFILLFGSLVCINVSTWIVASYNAKIKTFNIDANSIDSSVGFAMLLSIALLPAIIFISRLIFRSKTQELTNLKKILIAISYIFGFFISIDEGFYWFKLNYYSIAASYFILLISLMFCLTADLSSFIKSKLSNNSNL